MTVDCRYWLFVVLLVAITSCTDETNKTSDSSDTIVEFDPEDAGTIDDSRESDASKVTLTKVDLSFLFHSPKGKPMVSEVIRGGLFDRCFLESGALVWPNGYELSPDAIRGWISDPSDVRAP